MDKSAGGRLMRIDWDTTGRIIETGLDPKRLEDLFVIGVDEVSWRKGHSYLTMISNLQLAIRIAAGIVVVAPCHLDADPLPVMGPPRGGQRRGCAAGFVSTSMSPVDHALEPPAGSTHGDTVIPSQAGGQQRPRGR